MPREPELRNTRRGSGGSVVSSTSRPSAPPGRNATAMTNRLLPRRQAVRAHQRAVIGTEYYDRVIDQIVLLQPLQNGAQHVVHGSRQLRSAAPGVRLWEGTALPEPAASSRQGRACRSVTHLGSTCRLESLRHGAAYAVQQRDRTAPLLPRRETRRRISAIRLSRSPATAHGGRCRDTPGRRRTACGSCMRGNSRIRAGPFHRVCTRARRSRDAHRRRGATCPPTRFDSRHG